jgi:hypothetical protein
MRDAALGVAHVERGLTAVVGVLAFVAVAKSVGAIDAANALLAEGGAVLTGANVAAPAAIFAVREQIDLAASDVAAVSEARVASRDSALASNAVWRATTSRAGLAASSAV